MSKRELKGIGVSDKMQKTVVVKVERFYKHPVYKKFFKIHKKFMVDDPQEVAVIGDIVQIRESRPLSKKKRWVLLEVISKVGK